MTGTLDRLAAVVAGEGFSTIRCPRARVLLVLLLYAQDGTATIPVSALARLARVDPRDAKRALCQLRDAGMIRRRQCGGGRGRVTEYEVAPSAIDELFLDVTKGGSAGPERVGPQAPKGGAPSTGYRPHPLDERVGRGARKGGASGPNSDPERVGRPAPRTLGTPQADVQTPSVRTLKNSVRTKGFGGAQAPPFADGWGDAPLFHGEGLLAQQREAITRVKAIGIDLTKGNEFKNRGLITRACEEGLSLEQLVDLGRYAVAEPSIENPGGMLLTWLEEAPNWRSVLLDVQQRQKDRKRAKGPHGKPQRRRRSG